MTSVPVLTYHSQNIAGNERALNDHLALAEDLRFLHGAGFRFIPLDELLDWLEGGRHDDEMDRKVCLTFDDGCNFDVEDLNHPEHGPQRSFLSILRDFRDEVGADEQPGLHATSFVIASREAREAIDRASLFGKNWISDDWWSETDEEGLIAIESHGWDHLHPELNGPGSFDSVDTLPQCLDQVVRAGSAIEEYSGRWPKYFAYPCGKSSEYIRETFFPENGQVHGCRAAFGTFPQAASHDSDCWNLPRFVCGRDWKTTAGLKSLLGVG